jgi:hypothetical protein
MKQLLTYVFLVLLCICTAIKPAKAQDITADPGAYMTAFNTAETDMNKAYMAYISASAHSSRKRKIDKMRDQAINSIIICQNTITDLPPYKGDNSLRQSNLTYVQLCYKIFNDDYAHIVNMEEISERSYDAMQAYLLLQEATNDTLEVGNQRITNAGNTFAAKYGVRIVSEKSELADKMQAAGNLGKYRDKVYLLFFKCNWEDSQLTEAINQKNVTKIEQVRSALDKFAIEGLAVLDTLHAYENDPALADACKQALTFYKQEAETGMPMVTDFFLKEENFTKLKAAMDAKSANERTQQDVDTFNKAVSDMNAGVNAYNQANNELNSGRANVNNNWTETERQFADKHTPYYDK